MDILRIGIIGIGNMGSAHGVQIFQNRVKGVRLTAVCDSNRDRLAWAGERFGGEVYQYEEYEALLDGGRVDAVLIATPHNLHPVIATALSKESFTCSRKNRPAWIRRACAG